MLPLLWQYARGKQFCRSRGKRIPPEENRVVTCRNLERWQGEIVNDKRELFLTAIYTGYLVRAEELYKLEKAGAEKRKAQRELHQAAIDELVATYTKEKQNG